MKREKKNLQKLNILKPSERECDFSLGFWEIGPLDSIGARRKVVLRGEVYAWTSVLRSFNKLRKVGASSHLSFTLCLNVFMMLELIEAVSGRLIGPKSWNRSVKFMKPIWCSP